MKLFGLIQNLMAGVGIDVRRFRPLVRNPFEVQKLLMRERPCRVVFDVGAYQGDVSTEYAQIFPDAEIYAFEPFPTTFEATSARFTGTKRIHMVNAAITSRTGEATFYVNNIAATNSLLPRPTKGRRYFPRGGGTRQTIKVPTFSLDDFCAKNQVQSPDVLKLDIQGNELAALRGGEQTLRSDNLNLVFTETSFVPHYEGGVLFNELCAHLNERGFSLFGLYNLHWASIGQLRFGDAIFVSERLRRDFIDRLPEESN